MHDKCTYQYVLAYTRVHIVLVYASVLEKYTCTRVVLEVSTS